MTKTKAYLTNRTTRKAGGRRKGRGRHLNLFGNANSDDCCSLPPQSPREKLVRHGRRTERRARLPSKEEKRGMKNDGDGDQDGNGARLSRCGKRRSLPYIQVPLNLVTSIHPFLTPRVSRPRLFPPYMLAAVIKAINAYGGRSVARERMRKRPRALLLVTAISSRAAGRGAA